MSRHYHLIGIGGIGMSGIARLLLRRGESVSGSDLKKSRITEELEEAGAKVFVGHQEDNIRGADFLIYSSAVGRDNPELKAGRALGIPLLRRAQALAELMDGAIAVTVTGSHGKTTTASLVSFLLLEAGLSPTAAVGGILNNSGSNVCLGKGDFFVAEADESDGSFLYYRPRYSVVTNIDYEHLDYYKDFKNILSAYRSFLERTVEGGCVFACVDDSNLMGLLKSYKGRVITFGLENKADIYAEDIELKALSSEFNCFYKRQNIGRFSLALAGRHNISNALSVAALGLELGLDIKVIRRALGSYQGVRRRLEVKFSGESCMLIDDYAHHPTEIRKVLEAARGFNKRRVIAVFQPHRYSRTKLLLDVFPESLALADYIVLTDIYPAGEKPLPGVSSEFLYEKIQMRFPEKKVVFLPKDQISRHLIEVISQGDLVITLGAGDIVKVSDELAGMLKGKS